MGQTEVGEFNLMASVSIIMNRDQVLRSKKKNERNPLEHSSKQNEAKWGKGLILCILFFSAVYLFDGISKGKTELGIISAIIAGPILGFFTYIMGSAFWQLIIGLFEDRGVLFRLLGLIALLVFLGFILPKTPHLGSGYGGGKGDNPAFDPKY